MNSLGDSFVKFSTHDYVKLVVAYLILPFARGLRMLDKANTT